MLTTYYITVGFSIPVTGTGTSTNARDICASLAAMIAFATSFIIAATLSGELNVAPTDNPPDLHSIAKLLDALLLLIGKERKLLMLHRVAPTKRNLRRVCDRAIIVADSLVALLNRSYFGQGSLMERL